MARLVFFFVSLLLVAPSRAALNDLFPTDFFALEEGHGTVTGYLFDRRQVGTYVNGRQVGDLRIDASVMALRVSRTFVVGGWKVAPVAVVSGAEARLAGASVPTTVSRHVAGFADFRIGGTIWLIDRPAERHYLALNLAAVLPTGKYESGELLNIGENRRRHAVTLGWVRGLGKNLTLELSPEVAWYGSNTANFPGTVRLDQEPTLSLTGYLTYRLSPSWSAFVGGQLNEGGALTYDGVPQDNPIHGRRYYLGGTWQLNRIHILNLRVAEDASVQNGLQTTRDIALRWMIRF